MKKFFKIFSLITIIFVSLIFCCACDNKKPFVIFSSNEISDNTKPQRLFKTGEKIHYALLSPKNFKENVLKIQIFKQGEKSEYWGYNYYYNREVRLREKKYYLDYIVIHKAGHYIMQVFYLSNLHDPIILGDFVVQDR